MSNPFQPGTMAVVTLGNPREKLWGSVLAITPEGLTLCAVELASFEDLIAMVKEGEPMAPSVVSFPCTAWDGWNSIFLMAASPRFPSGL